MHSILGINIILDLYRFFNPEHYWDHGIFVVVETCACLGPGEVTEEFHKKDVVVDSRKENTGNADGGG